MKRMAVGLSLVALMAVVRPSPMAAQGFTLYETGACSLGRSGAGVAAPCADGSAVAVNPAGLLDSPRKLSVGGEVIMPSGEFVANRTGFTSELERNAYPVPAAFFNRPIGDRFAVGLGVYAPFGLTTEWDAATAQGRFYAYKTQLGAFNAQPTVAAKFGPLMVGAGLTITYLDVRLQRRLDLAGQPVPGQPITWGQLGVPVGTAFADGIVEGNAWAFGANVGALLKLHDRIRIGARYMTRQKFETDDAEARFSQVPTGLVVTAGNPLGLPAGTPIDAVVGSAFSSSGPLSRQAVSTAIRLPEIAVVGIAVKPVLPLTLMVDAQYTNWEVFDQVPLVYEKLGDQSLQQDYVSTWTYRVGGEYALGDAHDVRFRAGWIFNEAATPDDGVRPSLPENERNVFSLGMGGRIGSGISGDLGYMYVMQADRNAVGVPQVPDGLYRNFNAHIVALTFSFDF
ncbi:MAG: outer membrane protein transport protein [Gemmatimonadales bacterium]|nr:outer membrane protein transport protein [Gemmatimonadales bacterium]